MLYCSLGLIFVFSSCSGKDKIKIIMIASIILFRLQFSVEMLPEEQVYLSWFI